jgi:hypothetical protein
MNDLPYTTDKQATTAGKHRRLPWVGGQRSDGSCCRLALTDEDKLGRDLVVSWMNEPGLWYRSTELEIS